MTDSPIAQNSTAVLDGDRRLDPELATRAREMAARGIILLRNIWGARVLGGVTEELRARGIPSASFVS